MYEARRERFADGDPRQVGTWQVIDPELLHILVCPETRQHLRLAEADLLDRLNDRIRAGGLESRGGAAVTEALEGGLVREDGAVLYPIRDEIPVMLIDESIVLTDI